MCSVVLIVTGLKTRWPTNYGVILSKLRNFLLLHSIQTGYGAHPASSWFGTEKLYLGGYADHSFSYCAMVKNVWNLTPLPHMPSWYAVQLSTQTTFALFGGHLAVILIRISFINHTKFSQKHTCDPVLNCFVLWSCMLLRFLWSNAASCTKL